MPRKHVFCGAEVCFYCPLMGLSLENNLKSERKDILVNNHRDLQSSIKKRELKTSPEMFKIEFA